MLKTSREAEQFWLAMQDSAVAFSYFDSADRLIRWNRAYLDLNISIREMIREGAVFSDLLAELILRGQIRIPPAKREAWIAERLKARRHGVTAFRPLQDGRVFLAQERRDEAGGTLGFWLDVSDLFQTGVLLEPSGPAFEMPFNPGDAGQQDKIRSNLQTVLMTLEYLRQDTGRISDREVIDHAANATVEIAALMDGMRL